MSGDGTNDRGAKPPRTLFSLGRPGPKGATVTPEPEAAVESPVDTVADTQQVELGCGACGATLITGAAFCGECGTPVAALDDDFELVEEVPMGDLEDVDFGEYVEELPIDDAPAVLYAGTEAPADAAVDEGAVDTATETETVIAQPAAVLYADPSQAEPLPPTPSGTFAISEPSYGTADGSYTEAGDPEIGADDAGAAATVVAAAGADGEVAATDDEPVDDGHDGSVAPLVAGGALLAGAGAAGAVIGSELAADAAEGVTTEGSAVPAGDAVGADGATGAETAAATAAGTAAATGTGTVDGAAAETGGSPWADDPAATPTEAVPLTATVAAAGGAGAAAVPVAAAYGSPPPSGDAPKSKTGLLVGVAAAVVLVLVVGAILVVAGGSKDGDVQTAQKSATTTTAVPASSTTTPSSTTAQPTSTSGPTTTLPTSTSEPVTTATTVAPVTTATPTTIAVPTTPRVTVTAAPPTTVVEPGRIVATPPAGSAVSIPKGGSTSITLTNVGGTTAGCALTGSSGITASQACSPSIPPGGTVVVQVTASPTWEGPATVTGVLEGAGSYLLTVNVQNR